MSAVLKPWPIPAYPTRPPMTLAEIQATTERLSLLALKAEFLPECVAMVDMGELPVRYEITRDGEIFVQAVKVNGIWHDPIKFGLTAATIACLASDCADTEAEIARDAE